MENRSHRQEFEVINTFLSSSEISCTQFYKKLCSRRGEIEWPWPKLPLTLQESGLSFKTFFFFKWTCDCNVGSDLTAITKFLHTRKSHRNVHSVPVWAKTTCVYIQVISNDCMNYHSCPLTEEDIGWHYYRATVHMGRRLGWMRGTQKVAVYFLFS